MTGRKMTIWKNVYTKKFKKNKSMKIFHDEKINRRKKCCSMSPSVYNVHYANSCY